LRIPTIGIGAGPDCDGQILVFHDVVSLSLQTAPKFVRTFSDAGAAIRSGLEGFRASVQAREFPSDRESYHMPVSASFELAGVTLEPRR
jgi:3-methyl-2-oxobutanoate hydroxymethyltransferase